MSDACAGTLHAHASAAWTGRRRFVCASAADPCGFAQPTLVVPRPAYCPRHHQLAFLHRLRGFANDGPVWAYRCAIGNGMGRWCSDLDEPVRATRPSRSPTLPAARPLIHPAALRRNNRSRRTARIQRHRQRHHAHGRRPSHRPDRRLPSRRPCRHCRSNPTHRRRLSARRRSAPARNRFNCRSTVLVT